MLCQILANNESLIFQGFYPSPGVDIAANTFTNDANDFSKQSTPMPRVRIMLRPLIVWRTLPPKV